MDEINQRLVAALQENARTPIAELSRKVQLSPASTSERVRRMEEEGVIAGYHAKVNPAKMGYEIRAYLYVRSDRDNFTRLIATARATPEVKELHHVEGRASFIASIIARDEADLERLVSGFREFGTVDTERIVSTPVEKHTT
jgi:Lrp/AsnC family leucine-responsive transcriptional regulator